MFKESKKNRSEEPMENTTTMFQQILSYKYQYHTNKETEST